MTNNKFSGYTPKMTKPTGKEGQIYSGLEKDNTYTNTGNRLDRVNPYEFRKGMDYELTSMGISRLKESTLEEREKATESVLKNLEEYQSYYSCIIHYETEFRGRDSKPAWKTWLKEFHEENNMKEVDQKFKNDKMTDVKEKGLNTIKMKTIQPLKESIKKRIRKVLLEQEDDVSFDDKSDVTKKADTAGAKTEKGMVRFEDEKKAIDELLFGEVTALTDKELAKGQKEVSKENPAEGSFLHRKNENLEVYKTNKDVEAYKSLIKLNEKEIKALKDHEEKFGAKGLGNNFILKDIQGDDLPSTIKKLEARKVTIDKEIESETARVGEQRNEIAMTDMTREDQLKLLEIVRANGVSLREGSDSIRHYYEIAKTSFLEGLAKGLKL